MSGTRANTWMPLYIGDYLADTMHLNMAEHGAYFLLICAYWRAGTPLPDNDKHLSGICKASATEWQDIRPTLAGFFQISDGVWRHKRIEKELAEATASYERRKAAADASWMHRRSKADALHVQSQSQSHSSLRSEVDPPDAPLRSKRGTRLPEDWIPDPDDRAFAEQLGLDADAIAAEFRDYWCGVPGQRGCKLDWPATWRNQCRRTAKSQRGSKPASGNGFIALARELHAQRGVRGLADADGPDPGDVPTIEGRVTGSGGFA